MGDLGEMIACMKNDRTVAEIVNAHSTYMNKERNEGRLGFGGTSPCAQTFGDPVFIDKEPEKYFRDSNFNAKPVMFGANRDEGSFVLGMIWKTYVDFNGLQYDQDFLRHDFIPTMLNALGLNDDSGVVFEILEHDYFTLEELGDWDLMMPGMINLVGAFFIKASAHVLMKYNSINGGESYFYSFEYEGNSTLFNLLFSGDEDPPVPAGVTHGDDLIYIFKTLLPMSEEDLQKSEEMINLWTNFAIYGKPNAAENPVTDFPVWTETNPQYLRIQKDYSIGYDYINTWTDPNYSSAKQP